MSGFEIAGIILGAYPIIIGTLEGYKATRGGKGATSFLRYLNTERIIFERFVFDLVALHASEKGLAWLNLDGTPNGALWSDETLQKSLKARLGADKAENVVAMLEEIRDLLKLIQDELAPVDDGIDLLRRFRVRLRHVRFNMPQSTLKEQLTKLTELNTQLERLITERPLASASTNHKKSKASTEILWRGRSRAIDIYNALYDSYRCNCHVPHRANFGLPRISDDTSLPSGCKDISQFELLFSTDESGYEDADPLSRSPIEGLTRSWSQATLLNGSYNSSRRFSISECEKNGTSSLGESIPDLCLFTKPCNGQQCEPDSRTGFLILKEKQFQLQKPTTLNDGPRHVEQLDRLLTDQSFLLSRKERISLALNLSHAVLSLYSTPWIRSCWTWEDLCIDKENAGQIFAARSFYSCHNTVLIPDKPGSLTSEPWEIHGEPELTRLGFALIELALGQRLAELRSGYDLKSSDVDTLDYLTAMKLVDSGRVEQAEGKRYEEVVKSCLGHEFLRDSEVIRLVSSLPSFQANAERCIVEPLHNIVKASWGIA